MTVDEERLQLVRDRRCVNGTRAIESEPPSEFDEQVIQRNARSLAREMSLRTAIETMRNIEFALAHANDPVLACEAVRVRRLLLKFKRGMTAAEAH